MSKKLFEQEMGRIYAESDAEHEGSAATPDQLAAIENMLHTSTLEENQREYILSRLMIMSRDEADNVIRNLGLNQQMTEKQLFKRLSQKPPF